MDDSNSRKFNKIQVTGAINTLLLFHLLLHPKYLSLNPDGFSSSSAYNPQTESIEYVLHKDLLNGYDKTILPVDNAGDAIEVGIQPEIFNLIQVDERTGTIEFVQWLELSWKDVNLRWDPEQYENLHLTLFPAESIWRPDIAIYNQKDEIKYPFPLDGIMVEVFFDGTVLMELFQKLDISCQEFDLTDFPFDTQTCTTRYGSWSRGNEEMILTTDTAQDNEQQFNPHTEWELVAFHPSFDDINVNYTTVLNLTNTDGSTTALNRIAVFDEIHYDMTLRRKPHFYIYTFVVPSAIITTLCIVGLFAPFDASGNREEKVTLGLTTMLSMVMILMMVAESMPRSSGNRPLLGTFILFEIGLGAVATVATVVIISTHNRVELTAANPPNCLVRFTYFVLRLKNRTDWKAQNDFLQPRTQIIKKPSSNNLEHLAIYDIEKDAEEVKVATPTNAEWLKEERFRLANDQAVNELTYQTHHINNKLEYKSAKRKWIHIFRLIDWICMFLFIFIHWGVTIYLFQ